MTHHLSVDSLLQSSAEAGPDAIALDGMTYGELVAGTARLGERLGPFVARGDRVAMVAPNALGLVVAMHAAWRLGAVAVPLSARLREYDLERILSDAEPAAVVSVESHGGYSFAELIERLELPSLRGRLVIDPRGRAETGHAREDSAAAEPLPANVAAVLYTSGTTGDPKGVLTTHASLLALGRSLAGLLELGPADRAVLVPPASHAFGLGALLATLASGGSGLLVDSAFPVERLLDTAERAEATVAYGTPALFTAMLKARPAGLPRLRKGIVGGAPCPPGLLERLDAAGMTVLNVFGMSELGAAAGCRLEDPAPRRHNTCGRALPEYELRTADGGELLVRGPYVTPGYLGQPELTAAAFDHGWFRTGDLASIDDEGFLTIAGRLKEMVKIGGFNVFPAEVEGFLLTHPEVAQVAVVGVPDERMGEALEAFVVRSPGSGLEPAELLRYARPRIAGYKLPYRIHMVDQLPLLASGKPDRAALAASREREAVG